MNNESVYEKGRKQINVLLVIWVLEVKYYIY